MRPCPNEHELARAIGGDGGLADHLAECAACHQACAELEAAIQLARELPVDVPSSARREEVRTALLAAAAARTSRPATVGHRWIAPSVGLTAAASIAAFVMSRSPSPVATAPTRATIHPLPGAKFLTTAEAPDEIVQLHDGTIDIDVEPLGPGERFRVIVGDGEVEVRGTAFEVTAAGDHLIAVRVAHGRVEVTPRGASPTILGAGDAWHVEVARAEPVAVKAPTIVAPTMVAPAPRAPAIVARPARLASRPAPAADPVPTPPVRTAEEIAYDTGWDAMRANQFREAAAAFARSLALNPEGALAEDAGYWRAVALARVPRAAEAIGAFRDFLDTHPRAARAGEASAMLGWLLVDARELAEAQRRFEAAVGDPKPEVQRSARGGLTALAHRKP